ncbi:MAG: OmpA family protein [Paludibacter sp.]
MNQSTKTIIALLFVSFWLQSVIFGQNKYLDLIKQDNFQKAEKLITNELYDHYDDIALNYAMAILLIDPDYKRSNTEKAYKYLAKSKQLFVRNKDARLLRNLSKIPINLGVFENVNERICGLAFEDALKINTVAKYSKFIDYYKTAPATYQLKATLIRDSLAFQLVTSSNTFEAYQSFVSRYTKAVQYQLAVIKRDSIAYEKAKKADSLLVYKAFANDYPQAKQKNQALKKVYEMAYNEARKTNTSESYRKFAEEYPNSSQYQRAFKIFEEKQFLDNTSQGGNWLRYKDFCEKYPNNSWKSVALDSIYSFVEKTKNLDALQCLVDNTTGSRREKMLLVLHQLMTSDGEKLTLDLFYNKYKDNSLSKLKTADYEMVDMAKKLFLHLNYKPKESLKFDVYIRLAAPREKAFVALQKMISLDLNQKKWKEALRTVKFYAPFFGKSNKEISDLIYLLEKKTDKSIKINSIGNAINSSTGGEYTPVIAADDKSLYFCGRDRKDNVGGEDIFVSQRKDGVWQPAEIINALSFKHSNDAPLSVSADGTSMLLFKSGKILHSDKSTKGWTKAVAFPDIINAATWQADAMISSNGKALLFASTKKGGYNLFSENNASETYHGGNLYFSDIYVSLLNKSNKWGEPINLGEVINTRFCDRMPFLHPDMKTLYFSSDGHGGLGELDVYKSTRLADSCWNCWSEPINLGKEINTESSDWGYKIATDGQTAYFAKCNENGQNYDIFYLNLPKNLQPNPVVTISGKITDKNNQPISVEIHWKDIDTGEDIGQSKSDPTDGNYFIVLPVGKKYRYYIDHEKFFPNKTDVDLRNQKKSTHIETKITLTAYKDLTEKGNLLPFCNLLFNTASYELLDNTKEELRQAAKVIISNHLKIEIMGHTDIMGDENKNQTLSIERSEAVRNFLISEGCNAQNLTLFGYGKTKPIAKNDAESGRAKNRRVELMIVGSK